MKKKFYTDFSDSYADNTSLPRAEIEPEEKRKLDAYIRLCPEEISGLGIVSRVGDIFLVEKIFLLEQEVTSDSTDLLRDSTHAFLVDFIRQGLDPETLKLWWHSHGDGKCWWSFDDKKTIGRLTNGWMLSIVGNKAGEYRVRLDLFDPVRIVLDNLELRVRCTPDRSLDKEIEEEIKQKVTLIPPEETLFMNTGLFGRVWVGA